MQKELWDLFDKQGNFVRTFVKSQDGFIPKGLYHKTVEVIPTDRAGTLLVTRRSLRKRRGAGLFEFPAGSVLAGESSEDAAVRELQEETGLRPKMLYKIQEVQYSEMMRTTYIAYIPDLTKKKVVIQRSEVMEYRFVNYNQWLSLLTSGEYDTFRSRFYSPSLFKVVKEAVGEAPKDENTVATATQEKKPLVVSSGLRATKKRNSQKKTYEEDNDTILTLLTGRKESPVKIEGDEDA